MFIYFKVFEVGDGSLGVWVQVFIVSGFFLFFSDFFIRFWFSGSRVEGVEDEEEEEFFLQSVDDYFVEFLWVEEEEEEKVLFLSFYIFVGVSKGGVVFEFRGFFILERE